MAVVTDFDALAPAFRGGAIAIGNFDGVHKGHQALLAAARAEAVRNSGPAGVLVFEPHPRAFFRPEEPFFELTPLATKVSLLEHEGMDLVAVLRFDAALAALAPDAFIDRVVVDWLRARHVVIGYDFFFGKGRAGNPAMMQRYGEMKGFGVTVIAPVAEAGEVFSSSAIRAKIAVGDVMAAAHDLGRWWTVTGTVTGGFKRGSALGFPTANVRVPKGTTLAHGIYAVRVSVGGVRYDGAAYLGTRPTFDDGAPVLEVFLLDFAGDLYGSQIEIAFIGHIRGDKRFDTAEALVAQMEADCEVARTMLKAAGDEVG
ncbi:MAG: bifunctional riboflavin kinase/FAD synthetase [Hyphomicrobiaceae bacterium]